jgi:methionine-rich copper-binding protein CopC
MRTIPRLVVLAVAAAGTAPVVATADGHTGVVSIEPTDGASLAVPPRQVTVSLTSPPARIEAATVTMGGVRVSGRPRLDPADATRLVIPLSGGSAGEYDGTWRVRSADGHEVGGEIGFTVSQGETVWREVAALSALLRRIGSEVLAGATAGSA